MRILIADYISSELVCFDTGEKYPARVVNEFVGNGPGRTTNVLWRDWETTIDGVTRRFRGMAPNYAVTELATESNHE